MGSLGLPPWSLKEAMGGAVFIQYNFNIIASKSFPNYGSSFYYVLKRSSIEYGTNSKTDI